MRDLLLSNTIRYIFDTANPFEAAMVDTCITADRLLNAYFGAITLKDLIEQGASHPVVEAAMAKAKDSDAVPAAVRCAAQCAAPTPRIAAEAPEADDASACESCA